MTGRAYEDAPQYASPQPKGNRVHEWHQRRAGHVQGGRAQHHEDVLKHMNPEVLHGPELEGRNDAERQEHQSGVTEPHSPTPAHGVRLGRAAIKRAQSLLVKGQHQQGQDSSPRVSPVGREVTHYLHLLRIEPTDRVNSTHPQMTPRDHPPCPRLPPDPTPENSRRQGRSTRFVIELNSVTLRRVNRAEGAKTRLFAGTGFCVYADRGFVRDDTRDASTTYFGALNVGPVQVGPGEIRTSQIVTLQIGTAQVDRK